MNKPNNKKEIALLIKQIQTTGSSLALTALANIYSPLMYKLIYKYLVAVPNSPLARDDIYNILLSSLYGRVIKYDATTKSFSAYIKMYMTWDLVNITKQYSSSSSKVMNYYKVIDLTVVEPITSTLDNKDEIIDLIMSVRLTPKEFLVLTELIVHGLSPEEIAEKHGCTVASVYLGYARAKAKLREQNIKELL